MKEKLRDLLTEVSGKEIPFESYQLLENGIIDSFDIVNLISELEMEFGIEIDGLDIIPDNFVSIEAIAKLVEKTKSNMV